MEQQPCGCSSVMNTLAVTNSFLVELKAHSTNTGSLTNYSVSANDVMIIGGEPIATDLLNQHVP